MVTLSLESTWSVKAFIGDLGSLVSMLQEMLNCDRNIINDVIMGVLGVLLGFSFKCLITEVRFYDRRPRLINQQLLLRYRSLMIETGAELRTDRRLKLRAL